MRKQRLTPTQHVKLGWKLKDFRSNAMIEALTVAHSYGVNSTVMQSAERSLSAFDDFGQELEKLATAEHPCLREVGREIGVYYGGLYVSAGPGEIGGLVPIVADDADAE